ncbi:serine/threonine protein kinase [Idiomarina seosinensis]|uniref:serine/threonine protein kinase n=1 Tax=Idiomarina seosinensis TaxID=281739 RepID=UPI00384F7C51
MSQRDFAFQGLDPDTLIKAIEALGFYPTSGLLALNSYENRVYQFVADDNQRYVVKFYRPGRWSHEQIVEEHLFTQELLEHEIPVAAPLTLNGKTLHDFQGYSYCLFPSIGGRAFEPDNLDQLERLGRQIGRLHSVARSDDFNYREHISYQLFVQQARQELAVTELVPEAIKTAFFAILDPLAQRLKATPLDEFPFQRLHGDCHIGNILTWNDQLTFVDFDDCRMGPAIQDLWMMLNGPRAEQTIQLDALIEGYEEFCSFDKSQLMLIEPLRGFRIIQYMAWLSKRWQDSAFQRAFPWFAEERYWEQQVLALKEQLAALDEQPLKLGF